METNFAGVVIKDLELLEDDRGFLFEVIRASGQRLAQVSVSGLRSGVVKGFHLHREQTDHICCVEGSIRLVVYDPVQPKNSLSIYLSRESLKLVTIIPGLWHGYKNIGTEMALMLNIPDKEYDKKNPDCDCLDPHESFDWETVDR